MNQPAKTSWSEEYLAALRTYMEQSPLGSFESARALGRKALRLGMETLELARFHDLAVDRLVPQEADTGERESLTARAAIFFSETANPIEQTHPAVRQVRDNIQKMHMTLVQRTSDLEDSNWKLKIQTTERKAFAALCQKKEHAFKQLMADTRELEEKLQSMARDILSANEAERKKMSLQINDEIAQALLGINLRMAALKNQITTNQADINKEIAIIRDLVKRSVRIIKHLAHEFNVHPSK